MLYVLDACAMLALLRAEAGADVVSSLLSDLDNTCYAHAANLTEVYYDTWRDRGPAVAVRVVELLAGLGIVFREDMDEPFWQDAGDLKAEWRRVSLADCYCLALARRIGATVVTSDHHEFDALEPLGIAPLLFIR